MPRSRDIAEQLHTDIAGPCKTETLDGARYYQTITDDFSHFCVVLTLVHMSEATDNLINYVNKIENQTGKRVKRIRCDNGTEFTANKLKYYCSHGIQIEYTIPYSPQENEVSERLNKTLCDKMRTLLIESNLPKYLWDAAKQ